MGGIVTFNNRLTAIGGQYTKKVEVYTNDWDDTIIPPLGNKNGRLYGFTNLVINESIYVFGKSYRPV